MSNDPKFLDRQVGANSKDRDPLETDWSGSTLFDIQKKHYSNR